MAFSPSTQIIQKASREVYLFFIMSTLDEKLSVQNTQKVIAYLKTKFSQENNADENAIRQQALHKCVELWTIFSKQILGQRQKTVLTKNDRESPAMNWTNQLVGIQSLDMAVWNKFSRQARPEEILAILVTRILRFTEADLSEAQDVSIGTIRFRLARAAKLLGICAEDQS